MLTGYVSVGLADPAAALGPAVARGWRAEPAGRGRVELTHPASPFPFLLVRSDEPEVTTGLVDQSPGMARVEEVPGEDYAREVTGEVPEARELFATLRARVG